MPTMWTATAYVALGPLLFTDSLQPNTCGPSPETDAGQPTDPGAAQVKINKV
jgi:hypothetical protein